MINLFYNGEHPTDRGKGAWIPKVYGESFDKFERDFKRESIVSHTENYTDKIVRDQQELGASSNHQYNLAPRPMCLLTI